VVEHCSSSTEAPPPLASALLRWAWLDLTDLYIKTFRRRRRSAAFASSVLWSVCALALLFAGVQRDSTQVER